MGNVSLAALNLDASSIVLLSVTILAFLIPVIIILPPVTPSKSDALLQTHSPAGLPPRKSNLKTQHAPQAGRDLPKVQALMIYPIKSCQGIEVGGRAWRVLPQGLEFDRVFTFAQLRSPFPVPVDAAGEEGAHDWRFITQRQFPLLATVKVELWLPDEMKLRRQSLDPKTCGEAFLVLRFPWTERGWRGALDTALAKLARGWSGVPEREVLLPLDFPDEELVEARGYSFEEVTVWKDTPRALNMSSEIPEELQLYLGVSNKLGLFRIDPKQLREVYHCAPKKEDIGRQPVTGFQDGVSGLSNVFSSAYNEMLWLTRSQYPLHIQNLSSVQDFGAKVPKDGELQDLHALHFRPNIICKHFPLQLNSACAPQEVLLTTDTHSQ